jgi:dGTPase
MADYDFARDGVQTAQREKQCIEAAIMDMSDSIAYSVHDLNDFYRAGMIPLAEMTTEKRQDEEIDLCITDGKDSDIVAAHRTEIKNLVVLLAKPYRGSRLDRAQIHITVSILISKLLDPIKISGNDADGWELRQGDSERAIMRFLQNLVWRYVITNPRLATQQEGQRKVVRDLFEVYKKSAEADQLLVPAHFRRVLEPSEVNCAASDADRLAVDIVASLSENQATLLHRRFMGVSSGSFTELVDG